MTKRHIDTMLRIERIKARQTLAQWAAKCGVSVASLSAYEIGAALPRDATALRIAEALGFSMSHLWPDYDELRMERGMR